MKKMIYIIMLLALCVALPTKGQDAMQALLQSIEQNNMQLKALREMSQAEKLENKTANNLANPEVELVHKPKARGNFAETGVEVAQSFDFPTVYKNRGQVIGMQNERIDLAYKAKSSEVLQEARLLAVDYIYQLKQLDLVEQRATYARELYTAYERLFERGDINVLERNKTKLNLLEAEKDLRICEVDINALKTQLVRMNGGEPILAYPERYTAYAIPLSFDTWFDRVKSNNPQMLIASTNVDMSKKEEQLARSLNLPKLKAGYVGDLVRNDNRHGFLVSVSIPLWEGRNTVRSKKAQTVAMQYEEDDAVHVFRNGLYVNYEKTQKLSSLLKEYSEIVDNSNNFGLLKKAFDMGQLSLIAYLQELIIYHEAVDNYLSTEKEYYIALSDMEQWE